jgi:hypothetical protein
MSRLLSHTQSLGLPWPSDSFAFARLWGKLRRGQNLLSIEALSNKIISYNIGMILSLILLYNYLFKYLNITVGLLLSLFKNFLLLLVILYLVVLNLIVILQKY